MQSKKYNLHVYLYSQQRELRRVGVDVTLMQITSDDVNKP